MNERNTINVGVTGTNGKTSTVDLARKILQYTDFIPASLGTLGLHIKDTLPYEPLLIGPEAIPELVNELNEDYQADVFIFEAFSAAIMGKLYDGLPIDIAVLTYIGEDHLDYHKSKENYVSAKLRLFKELLHENGIAIYNATDERALELKHICDQRNIRTFTFGFDHKADLYLKDVEVTNDHSKGILKYQDNEYQISVPFMGNIFLLNWLAALSITLQFQVQLDLLLKTSRSLTLPPGRLEYIGSYNDARVYVDYAHTADALKAVLAALRKVSNGSIHLVFGCGGGRDVAKRSQMGVVAQHHADTIYITDDNPRDEDPKMIREQIMEFCPKAIQIDGRANAINQAISNLKINDILLVAGKGHENYQELKGHKEYFSDKETIRTYIDKTKPKFQNHEL